MSDNYQFVKYVLPDDIKQDQIMDNPQGEDCHEDNSDAESSTSSVISLKSISAADDDIPDTSQREANQLHEKNFNDHINQIWITYDEDEKNGLEADEARLFVFVALSELGRNVPSKQEIEDDFEIYKNEKFISKTKLVEYVKKQLIADKILKESSSSPPEQKEKNKDGQKKANYQESPHLMKETDKDKKKELVPDQTQTAPPSSTEKTSKSKVLGAKLSEYELNLYEYSTFSLCEEIDIFYCKH